MPPGASNRSTQRWLARRISRRWPRRCSPVASATIQASARLPRPLRLRRRRRSRHARSTCSSTAWRRDSPRATRPGYRRSGGHSTRSDDVEGSTAGDVRWLWLACRLAQDLWDDELWYVLATRGLRVARETGALSMLPIAATYRASLHVHAGAFGAASSLIEEADAITNATDMAPAEVRVADARRVARQRGRRPRADRGWEARGDGKGRGHGAGRHRVGHSTAVQRVRPLRRGTRGRPARLRTRRCRALRVVPRRADRGRRPQRRDGHDRRCARSPERAHASERHRLGARHRGWLTRAAYRRTRRRAPLPRGGRAARALPWRCPPRPRPAPVRRMAASREPPRRRA